MRKAGKREIIMYRQIKFRAKHTHAISKNEHLNSSWIQGYLADKEYINSPELEGEFLIDTETIGQYTGIKDANGKEIFEGDIVQRDIFGEKVVGEIVWMNMGSSGFYLKTKTNTVSCFYPMGRGRYDDDEGEKCNDIVLGNIYDDPELIKGDKVV